LHQRYDPNLAVMDNLPVTDRAIPAPMVGVSYI
jgi:hypothetical protein